MMPFSRITIDVVKRAPLDELRNLCGQQLEQSKASDFWGVNSIDILEAGSLWCELVNDNTMEPWRRTFGIVQFFMRHSVGRPFASLITEDRVSSWFKARSILLLPGMALSACVVEEEDVTHCYLDSYVGEDAAAKIHFLLQPALEPSFEDDCSFELLVNSPIQFRVFDVMCVHHLIHTDETTVWVYNDHLRKYRRTSFGVPPSCRPLRLPGALLGTIERSMRE